VLGLSGGQIAGHGAQVLLAGYLLMRFCCVTLTQVIIVLIAWVACEVGLALVVDRMLTP
jgi:hypothetical protein